MSSRGRQEGSRIDPSSESSHAAANVTRPTRKATLSARLTRDSGTGLGPQVGAGQVRSVSLSTVGVLDASLSDGDQVRRSYRTFLHLTHPESPVCSWLCSLGPPSRDLASG